MARPVLLIEALAAGNDSGLGRLTRLYLDAMDSLCRDFDLRILLRPQPSYRPRFGMPIYVRAKPLGLWSKWAFPILVARLQANAILHMGQFPAPLAVFPFMRKIPQIALLPDIGPAEKLPFPASQFDTRNRNVLRDTFRTASGILTCSDFTAGRIAEVFPRYKGEIQVVKPLSPAFLDGADSLYSQPIARDGHFILTVGNIEPRKNHLGLLKAYALAKSRQADLPPLWIVGHAAWGIKAVREHIAMSGLEMDVRLLGHLPDSELRGLYARCTFYVSPALYEGWGLPLMEALNAGCAGIYHRHSSQEEFAHGLALGIDCGNTSALADALEKLWSDRALRVTLENTAVAGIRERCQQDLSASLRSAVTSLLRNPRIEL